MEDNMKNTVLTLTKGLIYSVRSDYLYKKAFTLAEVLITLGIIGVVAAMTLPALRAKYEKVETVTRLKRAYSLLNQGLQRAVADFGEVNDWPDNIPSEELINDYLAPSFKVLKIYPSAESWSKAMCYDGKNITTSYGTETQYVWFDDIHIASPFFSNNTASMKLADEICIGVNNLVSKDGSASNVFVDVNGNAKGPNKAGYDLFFFTIKGNVVKPFGWDWTDEDISSPSKQNACNLKALYGGEACAARIMREGWEINYR